MSHDHMSGDPLIPFTRIGAGLVAGFLLLLAPVQAQQTAATPRPVTDQELLEPDPGGLADVAADVEQLGIQSSGPDRQEQCRPDSSSCGRAGWARESRKQRLWCTMA